MNISSRESAAINLTHGSTLTITPVNGGTGGLYVFGTTSPLIANISGSPVTVGPYTVDRYFRLDCSGGSLTYAVTVGAAQTPAAAPYLGQVATRCYIPAYTAAPVMTMLPN